MTIVHLRYLLHLVWAHFQTWRWRRRSVRVDRRSEYIERLGERVQCDKGEDCP